jgi:hypothetical protein
LQQKACGKQSGSHGWVQYLVKIRKTEAKELTQRDRRVQIL